VRRDVEACNLDRSAAQNARRVEAQGLQLVDLRVRTLL
jgi:hypothetical protein